MPPLDNPRHEAYAAHRARGLTMGNAYALAGFKPNRSNASRLNANEHIQVRIKELLEGGAGIVMAEMAIDAHAMFTRLSQIADAAAAVGDFRSAGDAIRYIITCLGYADNPSSHAFARAGASIDGRGRTNDRTGSRS